MRIALAGTFTGQGGIQTHFYWLGTALLTAGHSVLILSLGSDLAPADKERIRHFEKIGNCEFCLPYCGRDSAKISACTAAIRMARALREFAPDVYLACGTGWNLFLPALPRWRGRMVRVFHEVMSGQAGGWRDSRWVARHFFDRIVAQAAPVARNFAATFRRHDRIPVLPAFPEPLERTATVPPATRHRVLLGSARAAFFSRLVSHKRALWLVQQWPRLSAVLRELHIFGSGPDEEAIRDHIVSQDLSGQVFCHGRYPSGQEYVDLLSRFDMTLLPTVGAEGAPLVLLESMACGTPFVSTDAGGIPDYANEDCRIVPFESSEAFLSAVEDMAQALDAERIDQARLQQFYHAAFSFDVLSRRWVEFFESLQSFRNRTAGGIGD